MPRSWFPNIVRGKPILALTNKELDEAISDAEESYVFGSGMKRDKDLSDRLQDIKEYRKICCVEVVQSRLIVEKSRWELPGGIIRMTPDVSAFPTHSYICVLPNNEIINRRTSRKGFLGVKTYVPIIFRNPVTGYLVEFRHNSDVGCVEEWITNEEFDDLTLNMFNDTGIPTGLFNDPPDLELD